MSQKASSSTWSLLHACGDVSCARKEKTGSGESAPRMWRCFLRLGRAGAKADVCSTHVEMFLHCILERPYIQGLLHACGDVSREGKLRQRSGRSAPRMWRCFPTPRTSTGKPWSAPRMWRCFLISLSYIVIADVCSTHVEMFLIYGDLCKDCFGLLHACGDVSKT